MIFIFLIILVVFIEFFLFFAVNFFRREFPWLITRADERPILDQNGLKKFFENGFDPELGWIRKPNTQKDEHGKFGGTTYHIDPHGNRLNPGHDSFPQYISCYGDSFTFARQVNDNQTWSWYLSSLTHSNVLNLGVGNYGLDQALLRLKREFPKQRTKIVIMGVVPSTIVRILCCWKHYNEFGNTFGFKPMFQLEGNVLKLIPNPINTKEKFLHYQDYLPLIKKYDYFYKRKFKKEMIGFPYLISILRNPVRNFSLMYLVVRDKYFSSKKQQGEGAYPKPMSIIMKTNLKLRHDLFTKNEYAVALMVKLVEEFVRYAKELNFIPVFLLLPQKDDVLCIREKGPYYDRFINRIKDNVTTMDITSDLLSRHDLDDIYSDDNKYGGHFSNIGNKAVAQLVFEKLKKEGIY